MAARRVPPKQRHHDRAARRTPKRTHSLERDTADTNGYSAPSHVAGSFEESGYGSGHGPFGFTQHVLP